MVLSLRNPEVGTEIRINGGQGRGFISSVFEHLCLWKQEAQTGGLNTEIHSLISEESPGLAPSNMRQSTACLSLGS